MLKYQQLITEEIAGDKQKSLKLAESPPAPYITVTERHLQALWHMQKFFNALFTAEGEPITIYSPGIWNGEAGPDFLKAHLQIGEHNYHGDIEFHLIDSSWMQHGHHMDKRYNNVILHISLWPKKNGGQLGLYTEDGRKLFQTYLEPALQVTLSRLTDLIDLDLYPYHRYAGTGRCGEALFQKLDERKAISFFQEAAQWRLTRKSNHLQSYNEKKEEQLGSGIALALGYKNNSYRFLELFTAGRTLFLTKKIGAEGEEKLFAFFLYNCGFFEENFSKQWHKSSYYNVLKSLFENSKENFPIDCQIKKGSLQLNKIRPANHPVRRLAYLAKLCLDPNLSSYWAQLLHSWRTSWPLCFTDKGKRELLMAFDTFLPCYEDIYWSRHYTFEEKAQNRPISFVGSDLRRAVLVNSILPLIWAQIPKGENSGEEAAFIEFYSSLPTASSKKSSYLQQRYFGATEKAKLLKRSDIQQGAYQLHHDFCIHYEASCIGCPFVERFSAVYNIRTEEGSNL